MTKPRGMNIGPQKRFPNANLHACVVARERERERVLVVCVMFVLLGISIGPTAGLCLGPDAASPATTDREEPIRSHRVGTYTHIYGHTDGII